MNNKCLLLCAQLKSLLYKEEMNINCEKLFNDNNYAVSVLRKAIVSLNPKTVEIAKNLITELKLDLGSTSSGTGENSTLETEAQRLQRLKDKYKKDSGRT